LVFAPASLILTNYFLPLIEALGPSGENVDSFEEIKLITLNDGSQIRLNDENELSIVKMVGGEAVSSVQLDFPSAGYAGGAIHVSPCKLYILFAFYSGQSEEAFTLLKNGETLEIIFESGYEFGEAASYCFSEDKSTLFQGLPRSCGEWWMPWEDDDLEDDSEGNEYFEFGSINVLNIHTGDLKKNEIRIQPIKGWEPIESEYDPLLLQDIVAKNELRISWPWAEEILKLPLPNILIYKPGSE
jgi:hypothetical protein